MMISDQKQIVTRWPKAGSSLHSGVQHKVLSIYCFYVYAMHHMTLICIQNSIIIIVKGGLP